MHYVSFGTAERLKAAKFILRAPKAGDAYYWVKNRGTNTEHIALAFISGSKDMIARTVDSVFAPSAIDILQDMPRDWMLWFYEGSEIENPGWVVGRYEQYEGFEDQEADPNPAEAVAKAWLKLHTK